MPFSFWHHLPVLGYPGISGALLLAGFLMSPAVAQEPNAIPDGELNPRLVDRGVGAPNLDKGSAFDQIWSLPKLYLNEDAKLIQELSLIGRYHGQLWGVDSSQGDIGDGENRRVWAGARLRFLDDFSLVGNFDLDPRTGSQPARGRDYVDIINLSWKHGDQFQFVLGHQKPGFTWEYDLSSNRILTLERSLLVNQIVPEKSTGFMFEQKIDRAHYRLAGYSGQPLGKDFSDPFFQLALGYDLSGIGGVEDMNLQLYYLHNTSGKSETAKQYRNAVSTSFELADGRNAFVSQFMIADGIGDRPDVWGLTLMPAHFLVEDRLQVVARYQFANSDGIDGLQVQNRYERQVPKLTGEGRGDRYHAGYLGLNWYLYGNRLKVMTGVEYSDMRGGDNGGDFDGWTGFAGIRLFF